MDGYLTLSSTAPKIMFDPEKFRNKTFKNEEVVINEEYSVVIGPNTILENCIVINRHSARNISLPNTTMLGGIFDSKKKLTNWQEHHVVFDGVTFKGNYLGCDLGGRPDERRDDWLYGLVKNCDFSKATIHLSRLFHAEINTITFGKWPHFTVTFPLNRIEQIKSLDIPGELSFYFDYSEEVEGVTASFFNAEQISKKENIDIEIIKQLVSQIDGVIM